MTEPFKVPYTHRNLLNRAESSPKDRMVSNDPMAGEQETTLSPTSTTPFTLGTPVTTTHTNRPTPIYVNRTVSTPASTQYDVSTPIYIDSTVSVATPAASSSSGQPSSFTTSSQVNQYLKKVYQGSGAHWNYGQGQPVLLGGPVECDLEPNRQETTALRVKRKYGLDMNKPCAFSKAAWGDRGWFKDYYQGLMAGKLFECQNKVWQEEGLCNECSASRTVRAIGRVNLGPYDIPESRLAYTEKEKAMWQWENHGGKWSWLPSGIYR